MKFIYVIHFLNTEREEIIESNFLPTYVKHKNDIMLSIIGKEVQYLYHPSEITLKCIWSLI